MDAIVLNLNELLNDGSTIELQGYLHDHTDISIIWVDMLPGEGVKLHQHPYKEVFIIQEGVSTFTVGATMLEARAGQVIIAPANVPHKFFNSGAGRLRQIDLHLNKQFVTNWLED